MTLFLPLDPSRPRPHTPSFLAQSSNPPSQLQKVIQTILKAKRIVVVCGAGISVQAGIPDFRSPEGLFRTLKRDNPRENLASGKDLFDASVFNAEHTTSLFCQMIAQLSRLSQDAQPTAFHRLLRALDDHGKLLRVYTQNIDAIEQKTGLSFGVPEFEDRRGKNRFKAKTPASQPPADKQQSSQSDNNNTTTTLPGPTATSSNSGPSTPTRLPSPPAETPRCIPLHGTLQSLHCQVCTHSFPLHDHLASLTLGQPPQCPECTSLERTRQLIGKRPRGIGRLRPSVVLYNEEHKDGEGVGEVVRKDLMGSKGRSGADLLLVVGTSLRVPGTKRMVREFSKAVRPRTTKEKEDGVSSAGTASGSSTPSGSTRSSHCATAAGGEEEQSSLSMKAVYLNLDFPVPTREWEGVFDVWLQGDAQHFAQLLREELEKQAKAKELAIEKKRKRDKEAALAAANAANEESSSSSSSSPPSASISAQVPVTPKPTKRKTSSDSTTSKRRKIAASAVTLPPSPPKSPPTLHAKPKPHHSSDSDPMDIDTDVDVDIENDMDVLPTLPLPNMRAGSPSVQQQISPLMIRIPPRSRCYVDVPPLSVMGTPCRRPHGHAQATIQLPPTPEDTPPSRYRFLHTNTSPSSSVRRTSMARFIPPPPSINELTSSIDVIEIGLSEDEIDDYDTLPISCMRSTQIGLSASALSPDHG